jgi:hypothetical protein
MAKVCKSGGEGTFAERHGNGEVAPIPAVRLMQLECLKPTLSGPSWPDRQPTDVDQGATIRHASAHVATADGGRPEPACYAVDRFPPEAQS